MSSIQLNDYKSIAIFHNKSQLIIHLGMQDKQFYKSKYRASPLQQELSSQFGHQSQFVAGQLTTKIKHKILQVENKSKFFEGQLDSLFEENKKMKQQIIQLNRMVISSTQTLRNLLPQPQDPDKKIQLQLASIQGISIMIKQDWLRMQSQIQQLILSLNTHKLRIQTAQKQYQKDKLQWETRYNLLIQQYQRHMQHSKQQYHLLNEKLKLTIQMGEKDKEQTHRFYKQKMKQLQTMRRQYAQYIRESKQKCQKYENTIARLKEQIHANIQEYERNRLQLKDIFQQKIIDKQEQTKQLYESIIKASEQRMQKQMAQANQYILRLQQSINIKDQQIVNLQQTIIALTADNKQYQQQLEQCKKNIAQYSINAIQLQRCINQGKQKINSLQQNIFKLKQHNNSYLQLIAQKQDIINKMNEQIKDMIEKNKQQQIMYKKNIYTIEEQKQRQKLQFQRVEQQWSDTLFLMQKQSDLKYRQITQERDSYIQRLKDKHNQLEEEKLTNKQRQMAIKKEYQEKEQALKDKYKNKMKEKQAVLLHKLNIVQKQYKNKILEMELQYQNHIAHLTSQHNDKLKYRQDYQRQQQQKYMTQIAAYRQNIQQKQLQIQRISRQLNKLEQTHSKAQQQWQKNLHKMSQQHQKYMQQMCRKYKSQIQQYRMILQTKQAQFRKKLIYNEQDYQNRMKLKQQQYTDKLKQLQCNIHQLKANTGLAEAESRYLGIIEKMKQEHNKDKQRMNQEKQAQVQRINSRYEQQIKNIHAKYKQQIKTITDKFNNQILQLQNKYSKQLQKISNKLQSDITFLNEELLNQKQAHKFTKMTREEKIAYLFAQIQDIKQTINKKDSTINQLQAKIDQLQQKISKIDEIVQERIRKKKQEYELFAQNVRSECQRNILTLKSQCQVKIQNIETERIQFTQSLYKDFQQIKQKYQKQLSSVNKKYEQLQKLFEERPSRKQDLKKIKQLVAVKQKMDIEVKQFKKQVNNANQIVRYLSLQFQNYKDVYDIFGSGLDGKTLQKKNQELQTNIQQNIKSLAEPASTQRSKKTPREQFTIRDILKNRYRKSTEPETQDTPKKNQVKIRRQYSMEDIQQIEDQGQQILSSKEDRISVKNQIEQMNLSKGKRLYKIQKIKRIQTLKNDQQKSSLNLQLQKPTIQSSEHLHKVQELKSNAQIFMRLVNNQKPIPVEASKGLQGYGKLSRRRTQSKLQDNIMRNKERLQKFQLKHRNLSIQY